MTSPNCAFCVSLQTLFALDSCHSIHSFLLLFTVPSSLMHAITTHRQRSIFFSLSFFSLSSANTFFLPNSINTRACNINSAPSVGKEKAHSLFFFLFLFFLQTVIVNSNANASSASYELCDWLHNSTFSCTRYFHCIDERHCLL